MSTQEQQKPVERQPYQAPQLEQHGQFVQITGTSLPITPLSAPLGGE